MEEKELIQMNKFEQNYWWHIGRKHFLDKLLKKYIHGYSKNEKIVDFGCGTGGNYKLLSKYGKVIGIDNSQISINYCRKQKQQVKLINDDCLPFRNTSVDIITSFDALEHIKNDTEIIKEYSRVLKNKGKIFITVPAYKFMWSNHDKVLGHYRRYTKSELKSKFEENGFISIKASYYISFLFPLILSFRLYDNIFHPRSQKVVSYVPLPKIINILFASTIKIEAFLSDKINIPFGCSVVAVFKKNNK